MATCPTCRKRHPADVVTCPEDGARLLPDEAFASVDADLRPGDVIGEYEVEAKVGEGGFGSVYRARHPLIGKKAAIKVLAREYSSKPEIVARFIDEARAVNQIRHRGIIDIFAFGVLPDGRQYFVMELLEGESLEGYLRKRGGRLPPAEAIPILRAVARAVDAAHSHGIAHRDLKPDNVFLVPDEDGHVQPKLLDFGVAKLLGERSGQKTQTGTPIGTPHYMSPEQSRGVNVDTRTDVYSFGVMAYQMFTGCLPFDGEAVMDILLKQINEAAKPASQVCPGLPPAFDRPLAHMLAKDPSARPTSLTAAMEELGAVATEAGVSVPQSLAGLPSSPALGTAKTVASGIASAQSLIGASTELVPPRRSRTLWVTLGALALLAAGIGVAVFSQTPRHVSAITSLSTRAVEAIPTASTSAATTEPAAPAPEEIAITVDSTPAHAEIFRGDEKIGVAPGPIRMTKAHGKTKLTFKAPGHSTRDVEVDTSTSGVVSVVLAPRAGGGGTPRTPASHKTSSDIETPTF